MRTYQDHTYKVTIKDIIYSYNLIIKATSPTVAITKGLEMFSKQAYNDPYLKNLLFIDGYKIKVERIIER